MRWLSGGYPAAGDTFWSEPGDDKKKLLTEPKPISAVTLIEIIETWIACRSGAVVKAGASIVLDESAQEVSAG